MATQDLQMSQLSKFIPPPRKEDRKTKRRKNDHSRPPNEPSDQIYAPQEKRQKYEKTTSQDLEMSHLTKFIPIGKKTERQKNGETTNQDLQISHLTKFIPARKKDKKTERRKNDISRPSNETSDQIYTPQEKDRKTKK